MRTVLSIAARSPGEALEIVARHGRAADVIELRLDEIPLRAISELCGAIEKPILATVIPRAEGGRFEGTRDDSLPLLLEAARRGARWIDLDHSVASEANRLPRPVKPLISRHFRDAGPVDLNGAVRELQGLAGGAAIKLVLTLDQPEDAGRIYRVLEQTRGDVTIFAMGDAGRATRLLAGVFGAGFCYLAPDRSTATAPGQWTVSEFRALCPRGAPGPSTRIFGVLGSPIAHSISPAVMTAAFDSRGIDAIFLPFEPHDPLAFLSAHDLPPFRGFSVTIPFKERVVSSCATRDEHVAAIGAANTLVRRDGGWMACNTDHAGVVAALKEANVSLDDVPALVLGGGGAARAAAYGLRRAGARVVLAARRPERLAPLARSLDLETIRWEDRGSAAAEVIVHATPIGMEPATGASPMEGEWLRTGTVVLDMVYRPRRTLFLEQAEQAGCRIIEGLAMFLEQAFRQFELFSGEDAPREVMRRAALAALDSAGREARE